MKSIIDLSAAENALRLDRETILMLLGVFFSTRSDYIEPLRKAASGEDITSLKREAHRLKGAANNLRVEKIGSLALELEQMTEPLVKEVLEGKVGEIETAFDLGARELTALQGKDPS